MFDTTALFGPLLCAPHAVCTLSQSGLLDPYLAYDQLGIPAQDLRPAKTHR